MISTTKKKRLVLFLPHRADPKEGVRVHADLLPLELLQIAAIPDAEGYEVVLIDAMVDDDYMAQIMELCDGALLFGSSCILGTQVAHGAEVARAVRERFPELPIIWGGWFPSVAYKQYLREGVADAVAIGQGEITFWEVVQALENGTPLEDVDGLALLRDDKVIVTDTRKIVGWDAYPDTPWHLIDYERYVERQNNPGVAKVRHKLPLPWDMPKDTYLRGFSYYSSYGCPEPCSFCCSPFITNKRWKAMPADMLTERMLELHDRFNFNIVRFQDANFGVHEKRSNEWCQNLIEAGSPFWWNATYEIETIARYKETSMDLLRDAKCHLAILGAEAGSQEQQERIKKGINVDKNIELALRKLDDRRIQTGTTWIIGYPGEDRASMMATIQKAAEMKYKFPGSASDVFPFRPIPGSADWDETVKMGMPTPKTLDDWGGCLEYKLEVNELGNAIPRDILDTWRRYTSTASFYDGNVNEGSGAVRAALRKISGWRLKNCNFNLTVEQKAFDLFVKLTGQSQKDAIEHDRTSGVTPAAPAP
jgi:radical SAM superfamily enzyme YgiQ (UPF0313 family)